MKAILKIEKKKTYTGEEATYNVELLKLECSMKEVESIITTIKKRYVGEDELEFKMEVVFDDDK